MTQRGGSGFQIVWFLATAAPLAVLLGAGDRVTEVRGGLWQRRLALAMIPGVGIACAVLRRGAAPANARHHRASGRRRPGLAPR